MLSAVEVCDKVTAAQGELTTQRGEGGGDRRGVYKSRAVSQT